MRILVLGGAGMLGHKVLQSLLARHSDVHCSIRGDLGDPFYRSIPLYRPGQVVEHLDASDRSRLRQCLDRLQPEVIINGIGVVKQRPDGNLPIPTITLNALLPHILAQWVEVNGGRLIHISTDCVFAGTKGEYTEDDRPDATDWYGQTKSLGEVRGPRTLTLRTSFVGRELHHHTSLLEWLRAQDGKVILGFTRAMYSGVTTNYLARLICELIEHHPTLSGLYQVCAPTVSKYDLLVLLRDAYGLKVTIQPDPRFVCDRSMVDHRFRRDTGTSMPSWSALVSELAKDPTPYQDWWAEGGDR